MTAPEKCPACGAKVRLVATKRPHLQCSRSKHRWKRLEPCTCPGPIERRERERRVATVGNSATGTNEDDPRWLRGHIAELEARGFERVNEPAPLFEPGDAEWVQEWVPSYQGDEGTEVLRIIATIRRHEAKP